MTKELRLPSAYVEVKENEMEYLDGGSFGGLFFGVLVGSVCIAWGAAMCATGVGIGGGIVSVATGIASIGWAASDYYGD